VAGYLNDTIWGNKHLQKETKARIYKAIIRLIMTYTTENRLDTKKIRNLLEITEMKTLRIAEKTLLDEEERSTKENAIQKMLMNGHIKRNKNETSTNKIKVERVVRISRDKSPIGRRSVERSRK